jgi:hypothetical protein
LNRDILGSKANARQENFSCIIDHILRNHSGIGVKISRLNYMALLMPVIILTGFFLMEHYLDGWLQTAVTPGIKELTLELCHRGKIKYNIPCSLLSDGVRNSIRHIQLDLPPEKPKKSGIMFCPYFGGRVGVLSFQVSCFGTVETP